jgi:hypothetical protein
MLKLISLRLEVQADITFNLHVYELAKQYTELPPEGNGALFVGRYRASVAK